MRRRSVLFGAGITVGTVFFAAASCGPVTEPSGSPSPINACPEHLCSAYAQSPAPTCGSDGACATAVPSSGIELVIALSGDSSYAPYSQYVLPYEHLKDCTPPQVCGCTWPSCGHLPAVVTASGGYLMSACVQSLPAEQCAGALGFFLGNLGSAGDPLPTWLPVHATYRLLKDPWQNDVSGLPLQPVLAAQVINSFPTYLGPYGGTSPIAFQVNLPPGTYERTIAADPAYDVVFGPQVTSVAVAKPTQFEQVVVDSLHHYDFTSYETDVPLPKTLPVFDISREGGLDGWSAFLRHVDTKRTLSNVRPLSGKLSHGVQLVTNYAPASDALENAELVVAAPLGAALPTGVFAPRGMVLPRAVGYPPLPEPVTVTGRVSGPGGAPVAADVVFEALAFTDANGKPNYQQFEFTGYASARPGQGPNAPSTYSVTLPLGPYRVDVRPLDGSAALQVSRLDIGAQTRTEDFVLSAQRTLRGKAVLKDGRPLAAAMVEALPQAQGCSTPPALTDAQLPGPLRTLDLSAPGCLPRPQQTTTQPKGSFELPLDPGGYLVRIRPSDGTRLPWVTQVLAAGTGDQTLDVEVPAPFHAGFQLVDADGAPVAHAVVRAFAGIVEIGQTITATDGRCDLYMALPP